MDTTVSKTTISAVEITSSAACGEGFLPVGTLLRGGRYRIMRQLSSGGFGKTYVVTDLTFEKTVVVKEFYLKGTCVRHAGNAVTISQSDNVPLFDTQRTKFRKEAKRLYDLTHPNIVKVHDLFDENGTSYYTMDLVEGESLRDRVKSRGPLPEAQVWPILTQLLDALAYIHERHIWHLDLKPANVLVDDAGHVTLIDFGASKLIDNTSGSTQTTSSAIAYTPGYAPLEQESRAFKNFGPWTDFYALGATLYNIVTGQNVPTTSEIVSEGADVFAFQAQVSRKLCDLIIWMMKPNHKERPQSAEAICDRIASKKLKITKPKDISRGRQRTARFSLPSSSDLKKRWPIAAAVVAIFVLLFWVTTRSGGSGEAGQPEQVSQEMSTTVSGSYLGHDYVDLGLPSGTLWATCNIGAFSPEEYGDYFAWGETSMKENYAFNSYFDTDDNGKTFKKYYNDGGKTELDASDDAATANWGAGWRIPSDDQLTELRTNCTWTWTSKNGVEGYEVKSKTNNKSLFLPAVGYYLNDDFITERSDGAFGYYWSRSLSIYETSRCAYGLVIDYDTILRYTYTDRDRGVAVRPVRQN